MVAALFWPDLGLTLDEYPDYVFINEIIEALYDKDPYFNCTKIISFLNENPSLLTINNNVKRKGDS